VSRSGEKTWQIQRSFCARRETLRGRTRGPEKRDRLGGTKSTSNIRRGDKGKTGRVQNQVIIRHSRRAAQRRHVEGRQKRKGRVENPECSAGQEKGKVISAPGGRALDHQRSSSEARKRLRVF